MLYWLTALSDGGDFFNLFRYITFRAGGAFMTALVFGFIFGPPLINVLRRKQGKGQPIRDDGLSAQPEKLYRARRELGGTTTRPNRMTQMLACGCRLLC